VDKPPRYPNTTGFEPCATTDPELFFPERSNQYLKQTAIAKSLCRTCPVMFECAEYAIGTDVSGIWGATDEKERRLIQKQRQIQPFPFIKLLASVFDQLGGNNRN
jgi:WhiB family redox-sensing transcriptional regulator